MTIRKILLRFILSACILTSAAIATNGMNMIGYGARMSGMGGVSFGMTNSAHLMNTNPAGITSINGNQFDYGMAIMLPALNYKNYREFRSWVPLEDSLRIISQFSYIPGQGVVYDTAFSAIFLPEDNRSVLNDKKSELGVFPLPTFGFVNNSGDSRWAWGLGLYAQGGMGATYKGIKHDIFRDFTDQSVVHDPFTYQAANEFRYYNENSGWLYNEYEDDLGNPYFADSLLISNIPTLGEFPFDPIKYHSKLAYMKFIQTFAYELTPEVSVGLALNLGFSMMEMAMPYSISPDLMVGETTPMLADPPGEERVHTFGEMFSNPPELMGLGYNEVTAYALLADNMADAATAISFGSKLGVQFKMSDQLTLGTTFTPEVNMDFEGTAVMDMTLQFQKAFGEMVGMMYQTAHNSVGDIEYSMEDAVNDVQYQLSDVRGINLEGDDAMVANFDAVIEFAWPKQFGFGFAYKKNNRLTIAGDFQWLDWSSTMEKFVMHFTNGDNPNINMMMGAPDGAITMEMPLEWSDQYVLAVGLEFQQSDDLALRCGFNYGNNPVPDNTVIPVFPAVVKNHFTAGLGYRLNEKLRLDLAYEFVPTVNFNAKGSKVANEYAGSTSSLGENTFYFSLSREL